MNCKGLTSSAMIVIFAGTVGALAAAPGQASTIVKSKSNITNNRLNAAAPEFTLTSDEGTPTSLKDFRGKWVVLYFYPKDFTGGCTLEAHNFQRDIAKYEAKNAAIVGVSVDTADSHKEFCSKEGLKFRLLSDPDAKVSTAYDSVMDYKGAKLSARNTFVIDPKGKVVRVFESVDPAGHSDEVLAALAELQK